MHDFDNGWDSSAVIVDEHWVERSPRRAEVTPALRREVPLLGWLAPQLPLTVPVPVVVSEDPLRLRHRLIEGGPCDGTSAGQGKALGEFLRALHGADVATAVAMGVPTAAESHREHLAQLERFSNDVVPQLPGDLRAPAESLLESARLPAADVRVTHGDLGPAHVLVQDERLSGVIDWTDARVGDPALDLAWALLGTEPSFARALAAAYGVTEELRRRARDWHALGPWHEVVYGADTGQPAFVASGLAGVVRRLQER